MRYYLCAEGAPTTLDDSDLVGWRVLQAQLAVNGCSRDETTASAVQRIPLVYTTYKYMFIKTQLQLGKATQPASKWKLSLKYY